MKTIITILLVALLIQGCYSKRDRLPHKSITDKDYTAPQLPVMDIIDSVKLERIQAYKAKNEAYMRKIEEAKRRDSLRQQGYIVINPEAAERMRREYYMIQKAKDPQYYLKRD